MKLLENSSLILDMVGDVTSLSSALVTRPVVEVESTCRGDKLVIIIVFTTRPWLLL